MKILENYDFLRLLYSEIIVEKTPCPELGAYIKHFTDLEYAELLSKKQNYLEELIEKGVQTKKQKYESALEQETWTLKEEDDLLSLEFVITDNTKLMESMPIPSQKKAIQDIVDLKIKEKGSLTNKKIEAIGEHAEFFADRYYNELIPMASLYKDKKLSILKYEDSDIEGLDREELTDIRREYNLSLLKFSDRNLRILAAMPFILNTFSQCKGNLLLFLNKPIVEYTLFQTDLVYKSLRNLRILENTETDSPAINEGLDSKELLDWYDLNFSVINGKRMTGNESGVKTSTKIVSSKG